MILLFAVKILVPAAAIVLTLRFLDGWVKAAVEGWAAENVNGRVTVGALHIHLSPPSVTMRDVAVAADDSEPFLEAGRIDIVPDPLSFFREAVVIRKVSVSDASLHLFLEEGKIVNLPSIKKSDKKGKDIFLSRLLLTSGKVTLKTTRTGPWDIDAEVSDIDLDLRGEKNRSFRILLGTGKGAVSAGGASLDVLSMTAEAQVEIDEKAAGIEVKRFSLSADPVSADLKDWTMSIAKGKAPSLNGDIEAGLPLILISRLFPASPRLSGSGKCDGFFSLADGNISAEGDCAVDGLEVNDHGIGDLAGHVVFEENEVRLQKAVVKAGEGTVSLDGSLRIKDDFQLTASAVLDGVTLESVLSRLGAQARNIRFEAAGPVDVKGTLSPLDLRGGLDLDVQSFQVLADAKKKPAAAVRRMSVTSSLSIQKDALRIEDGILNILGSKIHVGGTIPFDGTLDLSVKSEKLRGRDIKAVTGIPLAGSMKLDCTISGKAAAPVIRGSASANRLSYAGKGIGNVQGSFDFDGKSTLVFPHLSVKKRKTEIYTAGGSVLLRDRKDGGLLIEGTAEIRRLFLADIRSLVPGGRDWLDRVDLEAQGEVTFRLEPDKKAYDLDAALDLAGVNFFDESFEKGSFSGNLHSGELTVHDLGLSGGLGDFSLKGTKDADDNLDFTVSLKNVHASSIEHIDKNKLDVAFTAGASARIGGTVSEPVLSQGKVHVTKTRIGSLKQKDSVINVTLKQGILGLDGSLLGGALLLASTTQIENHVRSDITITIHSLELNREELGSLVPAIKSMEPTLEAKGSIRAVLEESDGLKVSGTANLHFLRLLLSEYEVRNDGAIELGFSEKHLAFERVMLTGEGTKATIEGGIDRAGPGMTLRGTVDLRMLESLLADVVFSRGTVVPDMHVGGTWSSLQIKGKADVTIDAIRLKNDGLVLSDASGSLAFNKDVMTVSLAGGLSSNVAMFELGSIRLSEKAAVLSRLKPRVNAEASVATSIEKWSKGLKSMTVTGTLRLSALSVDMEGYGLNNSGPVEIGFTKKKVNFKSFRLKGEETDLSVSGWLDRSGANLALNGKVDLGLLKKFSGEIKTAQGHISPSILVKGPWSNPSVTGKAALSCDRLDLKSSAIKVRSATGIVSLAPGKLFLDVEGSIGSGRFTSGGEVGFEGFKPSRYEVRVSFDDVSLKPSPGLSLGMKGELVAKKVLGSKEAGRISGDVWITHLRYTKDFSISEKLTAVKGPHAAKAYDESKKGFDLDIAVHGSGKMLVKNNVVDTHFVIDESILPFKVTGSNVRPGIRGMVELDRGTFFWRGRSFKINSGKIEFTKENRIEPRFDIWASGEIKAFQVSLNAVGTPGDFVVQLFSNPALPEEDILLLVQFGMTRDELAKTGNAGLLTADVLSQSLGLEQGAKNLFPIIDQFQVTTEFSSNSNQVEPRALVGKNLTEDIKLSAISGMTSSQTLEKGTYFKAMVSYKASKSVNLEASYENENVPGEGATGPSVGNVGVDVKWRLEF